MIFENGYFKIEKEKVDIVLKDNVKFAGYFVNCFNRELQVLFRDITDDDVKIIEEKLDDAYGEWQDDDMGYCCEEYMLMRLPIRYKNKVLAIFYIGDEEDE